MGLGVSFRIAPGVRVRASSRGLRASIGPRAARLHVGGGRTGISTGAGPVTVYAAVGGAGRRRGRPATASRTARAQADGQNRATPLAQLVSDLVADERALTELHREPFAPTQRTILGPVPAPSGASVAAIKKELYHVAVKGIPIWRRSIRKQAAARAAQAAAVEADRRRTGAVVTRQLEQTRLDEAWQLLVDHDPLTVVEVVDAAFEDNTSQSTCVDAGTDATSGRRFVTAVVTFDDISLIADRRPDRTPGGRPTLKKRSQTERNDVYARALASTVLATAKEAAAVAVSADEVRVLVVRHEPNDAGLQAIYTGTFDRAELDRPSWDGAYPLGIITTARGAQLVRTGRTQEVVPLPESRQRTLAPVLAVLGGAMSAGSRPPT